MSSATTGAGDRRASAPPADDRTARARIRDAAIASFAEDGVAGATARRIATRAGVSPGLVIHHFGSMEGLRAACDEHVAAIIRDRELAAMAAGPDLDVLAALRDPSLGPIAGYLAQVSVGDAPAVARLIDDLVADAEDYLEAGVAAGTLRPTPDPHGRAVILTTWSLGALVLHRHVRRMLDVDLTAADLAGQPGFAAYGRLVAEILGEGVLSEAFARRLSEALAGPTATSPTATTDGATTAPNDVARAAGEGAA